MRVCWVRMANSYKSFVQESTELKSHSSALTNERISAYLMAFDTEMLNARNGHSLRAIKVSYNLIHTVWRNIRTLARNFPDCRMRLGMETKTEGVYNVDVIDKFVDNKISRIEYTMVEHPEVYTPRVRRNLIELIEQMDLICRDLLQYFKFNFRTDTNQTPDIFSAVDSHFIPDENTMNQLAGVVGKKHKIDFERLGFKPESEDED